jgi:hypothetical protein
MYRIWYIFRFRGMWCMFVDKSVAISDFHKLWKQANFLKLCYFPLSYKLLSAFLCWRESDRIGFIQFFIQMKFAFFFIILSDFLILSKRLWTRLQNGILVLRFSRIRHSRLLKRKNLVTIALDWDADWLTQYQNSWQFLRITPKVIQYPVRIQRFRRCLLSPIDSFPIPHTWKIPWIGKRNWRILS